VIARKVNNNIHPGDGQLIGRVIPEKLRVWLWLLRYGISDEQSLSTFMSWCAAPGGTSRKQRSLFQTIDIFNPIWLRNNIIIPVTYIVEDIFGSALEHIRKLVVVPAMFAKENDYGHVMPKVKEAMMMRLTNAFINVLFKFGADPSFNNVVMNEHLRTYAEDFFLNKKIKSHGDSDHLTDVEQYTVVGLTSAVF
jgi:hypothetical protein